MKNKFIGVWTLGMMELPSELREDIEIAFDVAAKKTDDWFYKITIAGNDYFIAENEEFGYTAMLPGEY